LNIELNPNFILHLYRTPGNFDWLDAEIRLPEA